MKRRLIIAGVATAVLIAAICRQGSSRLISATYYIQILTGIILRGAGPSELRLPAMLLTLISCGSTLLATRLFVKEGTR